MPGMSGEDSDATGAYTQSVLKGPKTWITLPKDRWPKSWHTRFTSSDPPVVPLRISLYGHPLAGLYWEQHCQSAIKKCGFEAVRGWECLFFHRAQGLFLSVYVDDFKLCGRKENLSKAWASLKEYLELDPPVPLDENIYLGSAQREIEPPMQLIKDKRELYRKLFVDLRHIDSSIPDDTNNTRGDPTNNISTNGNANGL